MPKNVKPESDDAIDRRRGGGRNDAPPSDSGKTLIDELEAALGGRSVASRADALRRVTDLFASGTRDFNDEQVMLFDKVMGRLIDEIEERARVEFAGKLAGMSNAPPIVSRTLALDDSIAVAEPLLRHSDRLDEQTLVGCAKTKSQRHLLAISRRKTLSENVTDVLVERGDENVIISTASNSGARFSQFGHSKLIAHADGNEECALIVWSRQDIPREVLLTIFESASEVVQTKLEAADRGKAALVRDMVKQAVDEIQAYSRDMSDQFLKARALVHSLHKQGGLTEDQLCQFAREGKFDETVIALSLLCDMPLGAVERTLTHAKVDQILVLAKAIELSWNTVQALMWLSPKRSGQQLDQHLSNFNKLKPETAKAAIKFYRLRERAANSLAT